MHACCTCTQHGMHHWMISPHNRTYPCYQHSIVPQMLVILYQHHMIQKSVPTHVHAPIHMYMHASPMCAYTCTTDRIMVLMAMLLCSPLQLACALTHWPPACQCCFDQWHPMHPPLSHATHGCSWASSPASCHPTAPMHSQ